jgi:hypothetical protein
MFIKSFGFASITSAAVLIAVGIFGGPHLLIIAAILAVLEISLSFDNAVVNATVLQRMNPYWQKIFLTIGILIAVIGMRLLFPVIVVSMTAHLGFGDVVNLALNKPNDYANALLAAHPAIASFGGAFLFMIFLDFMFEEREIKWVAPLERLLAKIGATEALSVVLTLVGLVVASNAYGAKSESILMAGVWGLVSYLLVNGLAGFFESEGDDDDDEFAGISGSSKSAQGAKAVVGKSAFFLFLYLEVLDASFSFDGVIGAFAISNNVVVIAAGLGIGALFVRSLTIYLVKKGTLAEYVYLEHGAHYAIGSLAVLLVLSIGMEIPDLVTGLVGVFFISLALITSIVRNKKEEVEA